MIIDNVNIPVYSTRKVEAEYRLNILELSPNPQGIEIVINDNLYFKLSGVFNTVDALFVYAKMTGVTVEYNGEDITSYISTDTTDMPYLYPGHNTVEVTGADVDLLAVNITMELV